MKTCKTCHKNKRLASFNKHRAECKECQSKADRERYLASIADKPRKPVQDIYIPTAEQQALEMMKIRMENTMTFRDENQTRHDIRQAYYLRTGR